MKTQQEIQLFLYDFKKKSKGEILYLNNGQTTLQNVAEMNMDIWARTTFLDQLAPEDFRLSTFGEGTLADHELWVFEKTIRKNERYIKAALCLTTHGAFCYSFQIIKHMLSISLTKKHEKPTVR